MNAEIKLKRSDVFSTHISTNKGGSKRVVKLR